MGDLRICCDACTLICVGTCVYISVCKPLDVDIVARSMQREGGAESPALLCSV
jgi:hypothetical protein